MEFGVLGPLEVRDGAGGLVRVPGAKERALLADLVVHAGRVVSVDRLVEDLWAERPPGNPANTLQGRVSALRRALGSAGAGLVVTRPSGYVLEVEPERVDAGRFERLVAAAGAGAVGLLEQGLGLWRGPALVEFADLPWAQVEAARLEELRLAAVERLVELRLAGGGHGGVVGELEGLVAAHPTRERLRGLLMLAYYRSGRQADALGVYQRTRVVLAEELGIDPSPELQRLHQQILVQDPTLEAAERAGAAPHNLPERLTSFVGRDLELGELAKLVEQYRLVTVTGPGGAGKTSVAVELARRLVGGFADGVWLVELAALRDPALVGEAVAAVVGLGAEPSEPGARPLAPAERLAALVADKAMLLVLDNCEHLVAACAELAGRLLQAGPRLRVLATSREVLGVPGEAIWPIPPLGVPMPAPAGLARTDPAPDAVPEALARYDAVRLFAERAAAADPGFTLDAASAGVVAELCRRLDGLPPAIELAAARVRFLPPAELAARLDDRFRLLAGGGRTLDPRQQTLRATIDWSWELLEDPDRRLLRRLSVFSGGWTVAAAEAVCAGEGLDRTEVLEGLFRLVDRSLVVAAGGEPARFGLLESLRAYGAGRLAEAGEAEAVAARHTAWSLDLAEQSGHGNDEAWLRRVEADYDNLRAAMDRAVAGRDPETALRLAGALGWYWAADHHDEGRRRLEAALALAPAEPPTPSLARALQALALVDVLLGPGPATLDAARRSLELFERFGDRHAAAMSKLVLGQAERQALGRGDTARLFEEAEATFHELGDRWGEAYAQSARFAAEAYFGEPARAFALAEQALDGFQAVGDQRGRAYLLFVLGMAARFRGQLDEAAGRYQEALTAARQAGPTWVTCSTLIELGSLAALQGEDARADELHDEAAALARRVGMRRGIAHVSNETGLVARARGQPERALALHRQALAIHRALLPTRVARTLGQLGCTEARLGDLDAAEAHLREAATIVLATPQPPTTALLLVGFAWVAAGRGDPELAARLLGAAAATRDRVGVPAAGAEQQEADLVGQAAAAALSPEAFQAATAAGRGLAPDQALREALG
jgi:predicted ATPase/DNA-binding SARP family transcriptional activator/tetratricopeptide (TPR) repeat protein